MPTSSSDQLPPQARPRWLDEEQHELVCHVEVSANYHSKRERRLLQWERLAQATAALAATAAFSQVVDPKSALFASASFGAAVASIAPLVFSWSSRANKHATLAVEHRRLLGRIKGSGFDLSEQEIVAYRAELCSIEANENASLGALVVQCQNEFAIRYGHAASVVPLKWHQRLLMHVCDWDISAPPKPDQQSTPAA